MKKFMTVVFAAMMAATMSAPAWAHDKDSDEAGINHLQGREESGESQGQS